MLSNMLLSVKDWRLIQMLAPTCTISSERMSMLGVVWTVREALYTPQSLYTSSTKGKKSCQYGLSAEQLAGPGGSSSQGHLLRDILGLGGRSYSWLSYLHFLPPTSWLVWLCLLDLCTIHFLVDGDRWLYQFQESVRQHWLAVLWVESRWGRVAATTYCCWTLLRTAATGRSYCTPHMLFMATSSHIISLNWGKILSLSAARLHHCWTSKCCEVSASPVVPFHLQPSGWIHRGPQCHKCLSHFPCSKE